MLKLFKTILKAGEATLKYPFAPAPVCEHFRGKPDYKAEQCIACAACTTACPANAFIKEDLPTLRRPKMPICNRRPLGVSSMIKPWAKSRVLSSPRQKVRIAMRSYRAGLARQRFRRCCARLSAPPWRWQRPSRNRAKAPRRLPWQGRCRHAFGIVRRWLVCQGCSG